MGGHRFLPSRDLNIPTSDRSPLTRVTIYDDNKKKDCSLKYIKVQNSFFFFLMFVPAELFC